MQTRIRNIRKRDDEGREPISVWKMQKYLALIIQRRSYWGKWLTRVWDDSLSCARELSVKPLPPPLLHSITLLAIKYQIIEKEDLADEL